MKRNWRGLACLAGGLVFLLLAVPAAAGAAKAGKAGKLTFGSEVRFRLESLDNFNLKYYGPRPPQGKADDEFLLWRLRLGFDYRPTETVHLRVWGQDARAFGCGFEHEDFYNRGFRLEHNPCEDRLELWETFLEIKRPTGLPVAFKVGRQRLFYGDKRVFGPGQWGNAGKWIWDAGKISFYVPRGCVDVYYGRTMLHEPDRFSLRHRHGYESVGTYAHFALPASLGGVVVEPFAMTKSDRHDHYRGEDGRFGDLEAAYAGLRLCRKNWRGFDLDATYVREFGDYGHDTIKAYGYHLLAAYNFASCPWRPRLSLEYSVGSGDDDPQDGTHRTFDGAFGARDKMYGRMNLFRWRNIRDAQVNLELRPASHSWFYLKAELHQFRLDEDKDGWSLNPRAYRDKSGNSGDKVGKELDVVLRFNLPGGHQLQTGYGHFWPDEFAEKLASRREANWFFVQWQSRFNWQLR